VALESVMNKIKLILSASILLLSAQVNASIVNSTNTDTAIGNGRPADLQGLEWLSLDHAINQSRDQIWGNFTDSYGTDWDRDDLRYAIRPIMVWKL
jgi:hypothetical protein